MGRTVTSIGLVLTLGAALLACAPQPSSTEAPDPGPTLGAPSTATPSARAADTVTFVSVVDGDTIETSAGTVRIIGIDTPERGECGDAEASAAITGAVAVGDAVTLELPQGQNDEDRYGRLIRFVTTAAGVDLGMLQLQAGNAAARYDSEDGYPEHPREAEYRAAQLATLDADGSVITIACRAAALMPVAPPAAADRWWEQYSSCTKLKKNVVGHPTGPFNRADPAQAEAYDWFANRTGNNGDGEGDGLACE